MAALTNHPVKPRSSHRKTRRVVRCLLVAITALWGVAGLHAANEDNTIVLRLKWWHQFQFAGFYAAEAKGYYQEAGLTAAGGLRIDPATRRRRHFDPTRPADSHAVGPSA
jgi:hypothetical protein